MRTSTSSTRVGPGNAPAAVGLGLARQTQLIEYQPDLERCLRRCAHKPIKPQTKSVVTTLTMYRYRANILECPRDVAGGCSRGNR